MDGLLELEIELEEEDELLLLLEEEEEEDDDEDEEEEDDDEDDEEDEDEEEEGTLDTAGEYTMTDGDSVNVTPSSAGMVPSNTAAVSVLNADTSTGAPTTTVVSTCWYRVGGRLTTADAGTERRVDTVGMRSVVSTAPLVLDTWKLVDGL